MRHVQQLPAIVGRLLSFLLLVQLANAMPASIWSDLKNKRAPQGVSGPAVSTPIQTAPLDNVCRASDRTYSTEAVKVGSYMPWSKIVTSELKKPGKQYVTIVNLTPHRFVLDKSRTHSYQMNTFDWDDIPSGKSRQNTATYTSNIFKTWTDTGGNVLYNIQGANKQFTISKSWTNAGDYHSRTTIDLSGLGLGQREYLDPARESPVTLVITGSASYGFQASLQHGPGNWMKGMSEVIKDRKLQHLVLPASHDSGMSTISNKIKSLGTSRNTQTQGLNFYYQLRAGARIFDLRVGSVHKVTNKNDYSFWTMHLSDETAKVAIGNTGESLDDVVKEVNQFTSEFPGEIIIFRVRYLNGILEVPADGPIWWSTDIVNNFFNKLKGVNNRCGNLDASVPFNQQPASYFMNQNNGAGCVLFLLNGNLQANVPQDSVPDGIYKKDRLVLTDNWSNIGDTEKMANDQVADWATVGRSGAFTNDQYWLSQWLVTANIFDSTTLSLENIAIEPTNPALYWMGLNHMSPESFPSAVLVDYVGIVIDDFHSWDQASAELYTFAVGMNLYMVSENCDINKNRSPLLPPAATSVKRTIKRAIDKLLHPRWNGIIYADGTIDNNPRPELHLGYADVLKNGTVFLNGTVVEQDMKNPQQPL